MEALTQEIVAWSKSNGASLVGIAPVERFDGAPRGHHPRDFAPGAKSVVSFGVPLLHLAMNWEGHLAGSEFVPPDSRKEILQNYLYRSCGYDMVNELLNTMALRLSSFLESRGYLSLLLPATYGSESFDFIQEKIPLGKGLFSHRHAAVRAGLGEFGLNNVVVTPRYGPRLRFCSVITEAELTSSPLLEEKTCLGEGCSLCLERCPECLSVRSDLGSNEVWYHTPARTDIEACLKLNRGRYCLGLCIRVCPVGQRPLKTQSKA